MGVSSEGKVGEDGGFCRDDGGGVDGGGGGEEGGQVGACWVVMLIGVGVEVVVELGVVIVWMGIVKWRWRLSSWCDFACCIRPPRVVGGCVVVRVWRIRHSQVRA